MEVFCAIFFCDVFHSSVSIRGLKSKYYTKNARYFYTIFNILIQGNMYIFITKNILLNPWLRCVYGLQRFYIWSVVHTRPGNPNLCTTVSEGCFVILCDNLCFAQGQYL